MESNHEEQTHGITNRAEAWLPILIESGVPLGYGWDFILTNRGVAMTKSYHMTIKHVIVMSKYRRRFA